MILSKVMAKAIKFIRPDVSFSQVENIIDDQITKSGAKPSFKMVPGYRWASCINLNEGIVHGIPKGRKFAQGDLVSLDIGAFYKGYHTDMSYSWELGTDRYGRFLAAGKRALSLAIEEARVGNKVKDISKQIQEGIEGAGVGYCARGLTGHGVGRKLHQEPFIPCFVDESQKSSQSVLKEGQTLALEVIYSQTNSGLITESDGWTISTEDGKISSLFEKTVAVGRKSGLALTPYFWEKAMSDEKQRKEG